MEEKTIQIKVNDSIETNIKVSSEMEIDDLRGLMLQIKKMFHQRTFPGEGTLDFDNIDITDAIAIKLNVCRLVKTEFLFPLKMDIREFRGLMNLLNSLFPEKKIPSKIQAPEISDEIIEESIDGTEEKSEWTDEINDFMIEQSLKGKTRTQIKTLLKKKFNFNSKNIKAIGDRVYVLKKRRGLL